jgi:hypothetical protein
MLSAKVGHIAFFLPLFSFLVLQQSCKRLYFISGVALPQSYFFAPFFTASLCYFFYCDWSQYIFAPFFLFLFCPFFRLPLAVGLFFLFGF